MQNALEQKFAERWPKWFNFKGDIQHTLIPFGFECGDGWFQILWDLCEKLEPIVDADFEVLQVKEKFAGLRFYVTGGGNFDAINAAISEAEELSYKTCEVCGAPGKVSGKGWISTLCDVHSKKE